MSRNVIVAAGVVLILIIGGWFLMRPKPTIAPVVSEPTQATVSTQSADNATTSAETENKKIVLEFEKLAFNQKDLEKAAEYLSDNLIQHNPQVPDGKQGFIEGMKYFFKENPNLKLEVKNVIAADNMVVLHVFGEMDSKNPNGPKVAVMDIFRLENGKIAEHWDVLQPIPEKSNNSNGMF